MTSSIHKTGTTQRASLDAAIEGLRRAVRGELLLAGNPAYEEARKIWNAMVDRHPALILRAQDVSDVVQAVRFAKDHRLPLAVRGGGHNIAGNAVCEGGLMLDLSRMNSVKVNATTRRAIVGPGATLADLDRETQAFGLVVPTGINSTTGIAGLTLGGGFGWTTRKFGMTIDNLVSADVVTANGALVHASERENVDLFWALRGGGGNFGVVTAFEFALHPLGPQVLSGLLVHPLDEAPTLLKQYRRLVAEAPDELTCWAVMRKAPPLPFIPQEWHGREVLIFALCYAGDMAAGEKAAAPFRGGGHPASLRRLAGGVRSAADAGSPQLLEEPRLRRARRRRHRRAPRRRRAVAGARMRDLHRPCRRCHGAGGARSHRLSAAPVAFHHERAYPLARTGTGRNLHRLGAQARARHGASRGRQRLCQFHAG
jgi:FAD/FMN-containing dehydrogenase